MKCAWRSIITIAAASTGDCAHLWEEVGGFREVSSQDLLFS
jgi:hypothetical protein